MSDQAFVYPFEKLLAWKKSRALAMDVYRITRKYPKDELFGLVSQMRRSSMSVSYNLSEGSSRISVRDQAHFYQMSYSSLTELLCQTILSQDLGYIDQEVYSDLRKKTEELSFLINNLRASRLP
jgi:four helix bundle protein